MKTNMHSCIDLHRIAILVNGFFSESFIADSIIYNMEKRQPATESTKKLK
jgi:hypothetical protein